MWWYLEVGPLGWLCYEGGTLMMVSVSLQKRQGDPFSLCSSPCENTARRCLSANREGSPHLELNLLATRSWTSTPPELWEINGLLFKALSLWNSVTTALRHIVKATLIFLNETNTHIHICIYGYIYTCINIHTYITYTYIYVCKYNDKTYNMPSCKTGCNISTFQSVPQKVWHSPSALKPEHTWNPDMSTLSRHLEEGP